MTEPEIEDLKTQHTVAAIAARLANATEHSYLRDFVYGGVDGAVTTFAVVSGVAGAELSSGVVIVLGIAFYFCLSRSQRREVVHIAPEVVTVYSTIQ